MAYFNGPPDHPVPPTIASRWLRAPAKWLRAEAEEGRIPALVSGSVILIHVPTVMKVLAERAKGGSATTTQRCGGIVGIGADWRDVQGKLLAMREQSEPYTSVRKLAKVLNCSDATIRKAIKNSETLRGWSDDGTQ